MIHLDEIALRRLRKLIRAARNQRRALLSSELLELTGAFKSPGRLNIDFAAIPSLGHPLVVVGPPRIGGLRNLTPRESEVATMVAAGLANKQIAVALGISLGTVKDHVHRILTKNGLPSRAAIGRVVAAHPLMDGADAGSNVSSPP